MENVNLEEYYRDLYEKERLEIQKLQSQIEVLEREKADLEFKLNRIKNNKIWKLSKPFRVVMHFFIRQRDRIRRMGSLKAVLRKIKHKLQERSLMESYGTGSFPSEEQRKEQEATQFSKDITFSILVPLFNTPEKFLKDMIDSVQYQTYGKWELCLADGSDAEHAYVGKVCEEYAKKDSRIKYSVLDKNYGISGNTNKCLELATGNYIALFDHDDVLHPCALFEMMKAICEKDADYVYTDEITFEGNSVNNMLTMHFKPDYSWDNLRANNYICHFSSFSRELLESTELFRSAYDGSQDHDMILRLTDRAKNVVHIPKALYYWRSHKGSVASGIDAKTYAIDAAKRAVQDNLRENGYNAVAESTKAFATIFRIRYEVLGEPKISIVIPNKDHMSDLRRAVGSILEKSTYKNYEIVIVENNSESKEIWGYYQELQKHDNIKVVTYEGGFNYSAICNLGVKHTDGDYVLLLNNDVEVITPSWMEEMLMYAQRQDVAAVGAKLYYDDYTIQHAGIVLGLGAHRSAGHMHYKVAKENLGYMGRLCYAQNVSAVTGACLLVKRAKWDEVGGLDESYAVALNDVDFCLKLREKGYLNVFTPFAELFHYESKTRGMDEGDKLRRYEEEVNRFRERWKSMLDAGDPYFNPNFSLDDSEFVVKGPGEHEK